VSTDILDSTTRMLLTVAREHLDNQPPDPEYGGQANFAIEVRKYEEWEKKMDAYHLIIGARLTSAALRGEFDIDPRTPWNRAEIDRDRIVTRIAPMLSDDRSLLRAAVDAVLNAVDAQIMERQS
jgi:hypothetical protein